jgi:hypothetical protein
MRDFLLTKPTLSNGILHVVRLRATKEMICLHAKGIITSMTCHLSRNARARDSSISKQQRYMRCPTIATVEPKLAILPPVMTRDHTTKPN